MAAYCPDPSFTQRSSSEGKWDELASDCRQELVFIRQSIDWDLLKSELDGCLLRLDEIEMSPSVWATLEGDTEFAARATAGSAEH